MLSSIETSLPVQWFDVVTQVYRMVSDDSEINCPTGAVLGMMSIMEASGGLWPIPCLQSRLMSTSTRHGAAFHSKSNVQPSHVSEPTEDERACVALIDSSRILARLSFVTCHRLARYDGLQLQNL